MSEHSEKFPIAKLLLVAVIIGCLIGLWVYVSGNTEQTNDALQATTDEMAQAVNPEPVVVIETQPVESESPQMVETPESASVVLEAEPVVMPEEPEIVLPALDESDQDIRQALVSASWFNSFTDYLVDEDLVRKFVTTVDNVSQGNLATEHAPVTQPEARFDVAVVGDAIKPDPASFRRYDVYVSMLTSLDEDSLLMAYQKYYPLMQEAYTELGYQQGFNQTLLAAIDELIATPDVGDDFNLVSPKVMYQFADPELENLPAAQKQLIRMGSENAAKVKAVLRKLRAQIESLPVEND